MNMLDENGHDVEYNFKDPGESLAVGSLYAPCGLPASTLPLFPRFISTNQ